MAKSILDIPIQDLRIYVYKFTNNKLKELIRGIYDIKWTSGRNFNEEQIKDIELRETILMGELHRRRYLTPKDQAEWSAWLRTFYRKKYYG